MTASPARSALTQLAEDRVVSGIRLALALATLAIIYIDPTEPERFVAATFGLLLLQTVFSGALYVLTARRSRLRESFPKWAHWADMAFYLVLIALSTGTNSIFFFGLLFPIMAASFLRGHCVSGLREEDRRRSSLEPAVRRFARKFSEATRIEVEVQAGPDFRVGGRVAAEAFQMVAEGLSNIRRHTQASRAKIRLSRPGDRFRLEIENDNPAADTPPSLPARFANEPKPWAASPKSLEAGTTPPSPSSFRCETV